MQAFGIREGELKPLKNNSWDQETPGLLLICNNMELLQLQGSFGFDDGTIEECMTIDDYARFESFETYDFITVNYFFYEGEKLIFEEIDLYIGTDYLVLILNNEQLRSELLARLQKRTQGPRRATHNYLYYLVFDFILDQMFQTLENLEDQLEDLEMDILVYAAKEKFNRIIELKAQVNLLKKYVRPLIYLGDAFHMNENKFIRRGNEKYFSGIGTRFKKLYDFVASLGELVSQIQNSYDSAVSMRESETSERLTLLAGMVAPLTVITGIYGMNFAFMPELHWKWSYPVVLAAMVVIEIIFISGCVKGKIDHKSRLYSKWAVAKCSRFCYSSSYVELLQAVFALPVKPVASCILLSQPIKNELTQRLCLISSNDFKRISWFTPFGKYRLMQRESPNVSITSGLGTPSRNRTYN